MIRSTKTSLKFTNSGKAVQLNRFLGEYRRVVGAFIDMLWEIEKVPSLIPKEFTSKINSWLTARMIQCAAKQASGIVRGTRKKYEQRVWRLNQLKNTGKDYSRLEAAITPISKPKIDNLPAELDERFVKVDLDNQTSFDGWLTIGCIGDKLKLVIPFKKHAHFNKMLVAGKLTKGVRVNSKSATFMFEIEKPLKKDGEVLGVDVGVTSCLATSGGHLTATDAHGHNLTSITKTLERRKKGSNGFRKAATHRKNFVNWSVNQLNLSGIKEVRREDIKNLRRGKRTSRFLSHWAYADIFDKLDRFCEEQGVLVVTAKPAYTSQICPVCKTLGKRRRKNFSCSCGYENDADLNAAANLAGEPIVPRESNKFL